MQNQDQLVS